MADAAGCNPVYTGSIPVQFFILGYIMTIAKAGKLVLLDEGVYNAQIKAMTQSKHTLGVVKVLKDFIPAQTLDTYLKLNPRQKKKGYFEYPKYLDFLFEAGLIEEIAVDRYYLGLDDRVDLVGYEVG